MTDEVLAEIESRHAQLSASMDGQSWCLYCNQLAPCDAFVLAAEARRARQSAANYAERVGQALAELR